MNEKLLIREACVGMWMGGWNLQTMWRHKAVDKVKPHGCFALWCFFQHVTFHILFMGCMCVCVVCVCGVCVCVCVCVLLHRGRTEASHDHKNPYGQES